MEIRCNKCKKEFPLQEIKVVRPRIPYCSGCVIGSGRMDVFMLRLSWADLVKLINIIEGTGGIEALEYSDQFKDELSVYVEEVMDNAGKEGNF